MKKVLITGANSYVGTNVEKWLMSEPDKYYAETLDMKDPNWKSFDFSKFDVVFHVAGIAHVSTKKSMKDLYFKVNRDLTIETAIKAKESGVKQFIFMSSMIVYSSKETRITFETKPNPDNFYGLSKLQAEENIQKLQNEHFNVCILRPPMIYGPGSKGNFPRLIKISRKFFIFPKYENKRSSLYIYNLAIMVKTYIDENYFGIFLPQNNEYFSTIEIVVSTRLFLGKKGIYTKIFNPIIKFLVPRITFISKLFSDFYYEYPINVKPDLINFKDSLLRTVKESISHE